MSWDFLEEILEELKFPTAFINLIMVCVRSHVPSLVCSPC